MNQDTNNMEKKLTNQEIAKVFAMYIGCKVDIKHWNTVRTLRGVVDNLLVYEYERTEGFEFYTDLDCIDDCNYDQLLLTTLSEITDEDAKTVAYLNWPDMIGQDVDTIWLKKVLGTLVINVKIWSFLVQKGYAVPLFFGLNHWANGKTAIELNIAIKK